MRPAVDSNVLMPAPSVPAAAHPTRPAATPRAISADYLNVIDERLMGCRPGFQRLVVLVLIIALACKCLGYVPRSYVSYAGFPVLSHIDQPAGYGTDTI